MHGQKWLKIRKTDKDVWQDIRFVIILTAYKKNQTWLVPFCCYYSRLPWPGPKGRTAKSCDAGFALHVHFFLSFWVFFGFCSPQLNLTLGPKTIEERRGDRKGQCAISINKQWRVCFEWHEGNAFNVEIVDYH